MSTHTPTSPASPFEVVGTAHQAEDPPLIPPDSPTMSDSSSSISDGDPPLPGPQHFAPSVISTLSPATSVSALPDMMAPDLDNEEIKYTERVDPSSAKPHDEYFKLVTVKVESTLFNLPEAVVKKHPTAFKKMLALRALNDPVENFIALPETSVADFERFYIVLIPQDRQDQLSTLDEWTSVLRVAYTWEFSLIRNRAVARLKSLTTAVDKVVLGKEYDIPEWLAIGYSELCRRESPINNEEGIRLGLDDVVDISSIRHHLRAQAGLTVLDPSSLNLIFGPLRQALGKNRVADYLAESPTMSAVELPLTLGAMGPSVNAMNPLYYNPYFMQAGPWQKPGPQSSSTKFTSSFPMTLREISVSAWAAILICVIYLCCSRL